MDVVLANSLTDNHRVDGRAVVAGEDISALRRFIFPTVDFQMKPEPPQQANDSDCNFVEQKNRPFQQIFKMRRKTLKLGLKA